ncbi:MAG: DUF4097 family beta strand repeat-containing protein [Caldiserica bacterium]|nr:DUF4097 family beta strand repeat-containing protein [Caldisericota bacterium]
MKFNRTGFLLAALVLTIALVVPGCITIDGGGIGTTTDTFEETYPDGDSIVVHAVKRTSWGKSEFDKIRIDVTKGDPFTVATTVLREPARVSIDYELRVPRSMLIRTADTTNGSIKVTGVKGTMELHTSNGSVTAENIDGAVRATTTNGNITLRKVAAVTGAMTTNGVIECEVAALDGTAVDVHTTNGSLTLWVAPDLPATLEASTTNGNLEMDDVTLDNAMASKHSIRGDLGVPNGTLSARTTNGNLTVHRLNP